MALCRPTVVPVVRLLDGCIEKLKSQLTFISLESTKSPAVSVAQRVPGESAVL